MRLSIFSSKIFKICIIFLLIFVVYNVFLWVFRPQITATQNQWQQNLVATQNFIYDARITQFAESGAYNAIIVGSSMSARLDSAKLEARNIYNLAFGGGSALSGLEIIKRANKVPQMIFVESNIAFLREQDDKMLNEIFSATFKIKQYLPALLVKYQPINVLLSFIKGRAGRSVEEKLAKVRNEKLYLESLERMKKGYEAEINMADYEGNLAGLKALLEYFENLGVQIIFFEMPLDLQLAHTRQMQVVRKVLKESFSYTTLPMPNHSAYQTTDGIHLLEKSAYKFSDDFLKSAGF